jgi:hypothetical protein
MPAFGRREGRFTSENLYDCGFGTPLAIFDGAVPLTQGDVAYQPRRLWPPACSV